MEEVRDLFLVATCVQEKRVGERRFSEGLVRKWEKVEIL